MINLVGILAALMIVALGRGQGLFAGWQSLAAAVAGTLAVLGFYYSVASHLAGRWQWIRLRLSALPPDSDPELRRALMVESDLMQRRLPAFRLGVDVLVLVLFAAQVMVFGWCEYVAKVWHVPEYLDLMPDLLPYFFMLAASWVGQYRIERKVRGNDWRPLKFFAFHSRANLMTVMPIVLIYAAYWAALNFVPHARDLKQSFYYLEVAVMLLLVVVISFFVPLVIRMVLPGGPLPDGRLRRRLVAFAHDHHLRVNQILVWRTGSRMFATAFVIGLASPFRYVFITDSLMRRMNDDEILAVYAHELGHVRHRHLWWLMTFILSLSIVMLGAEQGANLLAQVPEVSGIMRELAWASMIGPLLFAYFLFGYVSRRFERQADDFAARNTSPELMAQVFLKLGMSNPSVMKKRGWRHFSLEQRVRELMLLKAHPEVRRMFGRELWRGLGLGVAVTLGAVLLLVQPVRNDVVSGLATYSLDQFDAARVNDAGPEKLRHLRERTLQRSEAMGRLNDDYQYIAFWYEGVVEGLSGENPEGLNRMLAKAEHERDKAGSAAEREGWEHEISSIQATRVAIVRAREKGSSFFAEYDAEMARRGLKKHPGQ